jgi:penicillin-binding protein 1A
MLKLLIFFVIGLCAALAACGLATYAYFSQNIPSVESLRDYAPPTITRVFAEGGEVIGEFSVERRDVVPLSRMPDQMIKAFVAGEDSRFFQHGGVDYLATIRALVRNLVSGEIHQGGSTITQQVIKSLLLTPERSYVRKIKEAILAFKIERYLTKEEILFLYLNQIYLGSGSYGVAAASENYFGKPVGQLNLAEAALLAGLVQAPSKYSPVNHLDQARKRQAYVLNRMAEEGMISQSDCTKALEFPLRILSKSPAQLDQAPYFVEHIRRYVEEKYGKEALYKNGLQIYTTLDLEMQKGAQESLEAGTREVEKRHARLKSGSVEGALICFDLETGYVRSMVGGRDFKKSQFNRATQARRQTGSAFKPIVYASALDHGYTPASIIVDAPIVFEWAGKEWRPKNYEDKFYGPMTFRNALTHSVNVVTVKIARQIGIEQIKDYAQRLGVTAPLQNDLSMSLGSSSISLYELTRAYAVFGNQGLAFKPIFIKKITDRKGNVLEENLPPAHEADSEREQIVSPQTAYLMTSLLQSVVQHGTGLKARELGRPVAGKTGTTDEYLDAWFIGYTPQLVAGVWVGIDDEQTLGDKETGAQAALPIWVSFMSAAMKNRPIADFQVPPGIDFMKINPYTGQVSSGQEAVLECFKEDSVPLEAGAVRASTTDFFKFDFNMSMTPK